MFGALLLRQAVRRPRPQEPVHHHPRASTSPATRLTALTWGNSGLAVAFLYLTRFVAGMGIGGEYAAINSAIDEMMPARYRGRVDIGVNGTYWGGAILGTLAHAVPAERARPHASAGASAS